MEYFDLNSDLICDTLLLVKMGSKWVEYVIPIKRKDGSTRTYGDLYHYYSNITDFRFAKGYVLGESLIYDAYTYKHQYMYFSKEELPYFDNRELSKERIHIHTKKL